jgi:hypothetical protein
MNKLPPPAPGTWRRDDGQGSFVPTAAKPGEVVPVVAAPAPTVIAPPTPSSQALMTCPYGDVPPFTYLSPVDGDVPQAILDHIQVAHPTIWAKMQQDILQDVERIEEEFT